MQIFFYIFVDVIFLFFENFCFFDIFVLLNIDGIVEVNWIIFIVIDNSDVVLVVNVKFIGVCLLYNFNEILIVMYIVVDLNGNIVLCIFYIRVEGKMFYVYLVLYKIMNFCYL